MGGLLDGAAGFLSDPMILIQGAIFLGILFLVLAGAAIFNREPSVTDRLGAVAAGGPKASLRYKAGERGWLALLSRLDRYVGDKDWSKRTSVRQRLLRAGYYNPHAVSYYFAIRALLGLGLPAILMLLTLFGILAVKPEYLALTYVGSCVLGYMLPALSIYNSTQKRQEAFRNGFPDTLDLLLVCVESGLSLSAAITRISTELAHSNPVIAEHFRIAVLEMQAGVSRTAALRNLSDRVGIEEVSALVTLLAQSEAMGVSIAQSLRVYAEEMRRKRLVKAEEKANKLPLKMMGPLLLFLFPAFMIVLLSPAVIRVMKMFSGG